MDLKTPGSDEIQQIIGKVLPKKGLSNDQVKKLTNLGLDNTFKNDSYKSVWQIVADNLFTFFNLIFFVLGFFLFLVHSYKDMLFMFVILANTLIGIFQQIRSKIKLDKLNLISTLKTTVVRDGASRKILNSEIVQGDVIVLKTGDQITVDAVVLSGSMQIDESLLTGESDPITKQEGSKLLSGSFVLSGDCYAQVTHVGKDCYANRLTLEAKKSSKQVNSEMIRSLNRLIKVIGVVLIPVGVLTFAKETMVLHHDYGKAVQSVAALLVGMIPEGLFLLTSVALAMSVVKLMESKTLVHEMGCIETLARVDMLCVDKTGTITQPKMEVVDVIFLNSKEINEKDYYISILTEVIANMPGDSETALALKKRFISREKLNLFVNKIYPFLSSTKRFAVDFKEKGVFLIGAPEFILKDSYSSISNIVEQYASEGKRVLLFAHLNGLIEGEHNERLNGEIKSICLILIENPIRSTAEQTFRFFEDQGVEIKVISGDNPVAVSSICKKIKLKNAQNYVDASQLVTSEDMEKALKSATVFGRVSPNQKQQFVKILQKKGKHVVAMTGDGVNDVLALRQADVGVAMASGSSAASQAAAIVLLDSNFASMPAVVFEGRRVINNIERSAALFLVKNIFSFSFAIMTLFFKIGFPITPFQSSCISFFTIGMPSFLLTLENTSELIRGKFLSNVLKKAIPGGFCNVLMVLFTQFLVGNIFKFADNEVSAICFVVLIFNGLLILSELCKPMNRKRLAVLLMTIGTLIASAVSLLTICRDIFYFTLFSNYFVLFLLIVLFVVDYLMLKSLTTLFKFQFIRKLLKKVKKIIKTIRRLFP